MSGQQIKTRLLPHDHMSVDELTRLAEKLSSSAKLNSADRDAIVDVLVRCAAAQRQWNHAYSTPYNRDLHRRLVLAGILGRLLNRWS